VPFPNFHSARLIDPKRFERFATQKNQGGDGVDFILGIRADDGSEIQAIRFDRTKFTVAEARKWLADHDFKPILFEEATGEGMQEQVGEDGPIDVDKAPKLENEVLNLREKDFPKGRCGLCRYFVEPNVCKILEGPVAAELVCDGFQGIEEGFPPYEVRDEDWLDFVNGMVKEQPYQHIVVAGHLTPAGPIVIIKDTIKPKPHIFSLSKKFHIGHTSTEHHWTQEDVDQLIRDGGGMAEAIFEGIRPAFGSPGGKKLLAQTIVGLIPEHTIYVEPFAGAVFFAKDPSELEVLNDKDSEIAEAFQFIQASTEADRGKLRAMPLDRDQKTFERLKASSNGSPVERFHRFLYTNAFSMGNSRESYADGVAKTISHKIDRMDRLAERLADVRISSKDFRDVITEHDGPKTCFYLDPPYPTQQGALKTDLKTADIVEAVKKIRGKFILSLPDDRETREAFRGFEIQKVSVRRTMNMANPHVDGELLIANFPMRQSDRIAASVDDVTVELVESLRPFLAALPDRGSAYLTERERLLKMSP
jgi:DNA adenine methylase